MNFNLLFTIRYEQVWDSPEPGVHKKSFLLSHSLPKRGNPLPSPTGRKG